MQYHETTSPQTLGRFVLVQEGTGDEFLKWVNALCDEGYEPVGSVGGSVAFGYQQAMFYPYDRWEGRAYG